MSTRALAAALLVLSAFAAFAQEPSAAEAEAEKVFKSVDWVVGPGKGPMKDIAAIDVPAGYIFAKAADVPKLMELMENPVSGREAGFLATEDMSWFMVLEFDDDGYVKDEDKDELDAGTLMSTMTENQQSGNEARKERGWDELKLQGWATEPHYDVKTNNLKWAIKLSSSQDGFKELWGVS